jgi:hypothetical protein
MNAVCGAVRPEVSPKFCVVKVNDTARWSPGIAGRGRTILGVYLFDAHSLACGDAAPEYECLFVGSQFDNPALPDHEADWLSVEIGEAADQADPVRYLPCDRIDALPRIEEGELPEGFIDLDIDNEEDAIEFLRLRAV